MPGEATEDDRKLARMLLEHRDVLFAYILALVRNWNVAEELFQEVSLVVLQKGQEGEDVQQFLPWSREIARRMVLNYWKTTSRSRLILSSEALDSIDKAFADRDEEIEAPGHELLKSLRRCLQRLPDHLRRLVDLRYNQALALDEIARRLDRSSGSVQVALSRIRMRLLECTQRAQPEGGVNPA